MFNNYLIVPIQIAEETEEKFKVQGEKQEIQEKKLEELQVCNHTHTPATTHILNTYIILRFNFPLFHSIFHNDQGTKLFIKSTTFIIFSS